MHNKNNVGLKKINFENKPSTASPINATNLNLLQNNVDELCQTIQDDIAIDIDTISKNIEELKESNIYSTEEKVIGKWIDGKPVYRKVIDTGTLPDSVGKQIPHNISNVNQIINIKGYAYRSSDNIYLPLPHATYDNTAISCYADRTEITIVTYTNRTSFKTSYVILEYTKTTDEVSNE